MTQATLQVRVAAKTIEATDICSFELVAIDGQTLPLFGAGAHIDVHIDVAMGDGLSRSYSLCNDPRATDHYLIAVLRDPASRGGSVAMHERIKVGDVIRISEPKNHFQLAHAAEYSLLLAGGIGVTPLLCMAERLHNTGASFAMHYCARSQDRMAFTQRLAASPFAAQVQLHFDDGDAAQKLDIAALLAAPKAGTHLYVCGPSGFLKFVRDTALAQGWPSECVHFEYFSAELATTTGDQAFDVKIASTGKVYRIAADRTVTEALAERGVEVPVSCEQGVCGTCLTRVLEGVPEHRDYFLSPDEQARNDQFTPCCSRARSGLLVLDL